MRTTLAIALLCLLAGRAGAAEPEEADPHAGHEGHAQHGAAAGHGDHANAYAPIGVMGDHLHEEGEFMLSYRYMRMHMDGNRDGNDSVPISNILLPRGTYRATPTEMNMQMHMLGGMYAPKSWVTLMVMLPIVVLDMDHKTAMGQNFTTRSSGLGDIKTTALLRLWEHEQHRVHANAGISWPSGSIDRKDNTPASGGQNTLLPYPMQLGSGTVDLLPGVTYNAHDDLFSWGAQAMGTIRLGRNEENYRLGNRYSLTGWGSVMPVSWMSTGLRMEWRQWFDIEGQDDRLADPMGIPAEDFIPTADPNLRAGKQLDLGPSVNFLVRDGPLGGLRFAFEMLFPLYRHLDGPQLETDWTLTAGVQYAF
jgi:hypothetical protein